MKKKILLSVATLALLGGMVVGCGGPGDQPSDNPETPDDPYAGLTGTGLAVAKANNMTLAELEQASKKEVEENPNGKMKVVGLTSVLKSVAKTVAAKYEWLKYGGEDDNIDVNNSYKDYQLLQALNTAETSYFADYALAQDVRSFSAYIEDGLTFNFKPSDGKTALGLTDAELEPLHGVHFNKLFWTNKNFEHITGKKLYNIWQVAGSKDDADHLSKVSFQSPTTEQINMSFLVSCYAEENQARILKAYKDYYGKDWESTINSKTGLPDYANAGQQWVAEFIKNVSIWHSSDGTAMKQTQLKDAWNEGVVYYGAFAKMKDAVANNYKVDLNNDGEVKDDESITVECDGVEYTFSNADNEGKGPNAMDTVKWDWEINGFNGFMYCMDSQIINNAKFPYTACLFARTMLEEKTYTDAIYNSKNPDAEGNPANQYGYYYPGQASADFRYAKGDWTKEKHIENEINENYQYLKNVKNSTINSILSLITK